MGKIWEFFEELDEYVYASDMDTYELIYMNRKAREAFGVDQPEQLAGQKCHEVMQNSALPCATCNNAQLEAGHFREWRYFNPIIGRNLVIKDTMVEDEGRRVRIEIALDANKQERQSSQLILRRDLAATVNEGLRVSLRAATPEQSINVLLEFLGKSLWGKRAFIFENNDHGGISNTYEWVAKGREPDKEKLQDIPAELCAVWFREFEEGRNVVLYDPEQIRWKDQVTYKQLKRTGVRTLVMVPLYNDPDVIGFIGVEDPPSEILEDASSMLQIVGHFVVSCFNRRNLVRNLQNLSYHDQLTEVGNRHAMWETVDRLQDGDSIGLVYCDVTGLKAVNDTKGHQAGDKLIVDCCGCLVDVFGKERIFRIGGDELLALLPGISEQEHDQRVAELRAVAEERKLVLAVGAVWEAEGCPTCFQKLLTEAEHLMYQDKSAYYRQAGLDRRR